MRGDLHNFAKAVRRIQAPDGTIYFEKPRTLFWEWIFFGCDSPIRPFFPVYAQDLFTLEMKFEDGTFNGLVKELRASNNVALSDDLFYKFGILLGYTYTFGIQDLHANNIIKTDTALVPIDIEAPLSEFILPNESLLLPFRETGFDESGLGHYLTSMSALAPIGAQNIIKGFSDILFELEKSRVYITDQIERALSDRSVPLRVFVRNTAEYRDWNTKKFENPFLKEEIEQLARGDIPYFYMSFGENRLKYYRAPDFEAEVDVPTWLVGKLKTNGATLASLLSSERIKQRLFPYGMLFLSRNLFANNWTGSFNGTEFQSEISKNEIAVTSSWGTFKAKRVRT